MLLEQQPTELKALAEQIALALSRDHGPMMGGKLLCKTLGYASANAFRQAVARGKLPVPVFTVENRRGKFALSSDVAWWLAKQRLNASTNQKAANH